MRSTMSDVILEAEMVAFSDATERIDGNSHPRFLSRTTPNCFFFRILENSEPHREHRSRFKAQNPQDASGDTRDVSTGHWRPSKSGN